LDAQFNYAARDVQSKFLIVTCADAMLCDLEHRHFVSGQVLTRWILAINGLAGISKGIQVALR